MRRLLRWIAGGGIGAIALLAVLLAGLVCLRSEQVRRRTYSIPLHPIRVAADSATLAEGERLARVRGCFGGCHGERFEGKVFFEQARVGRLVAPSLTRAAARWDDADLARIIRHGVRPNGRGVYGMPAHTFSGLSDADLGAILAFVRHAPVEPGLAPSLDLGPLGRLGIVLGKYRSEAAIIAHDSVQPPATAPSQPEALGIYLARTICTECHGSDLHGDPAVGSMDLRVVASYSRTEFGRLLREGIPRDGRQLGLMGRTAIGRLRYLTDAEVDALHRYLQALP